MIFFLTEGGNGNEALKNELWHLGRQLRSHIDGIAEKYKDEKMTSNPTKKEAYDHLMDVIEWDNGKGIKYNEMKRIKHWFDHHINSTDTIQYELYGGDRMKTWVNGELDSAARRVKSEKEALRRAGKSNAFKKEHEADRQTVATQVDDKTPTYNPATGNKQNRLKELSALNESSTIILSERQIKQIMNYL